MQKIRDFFTHKSITQYLVKSTIYIVIFFVILALLWQFLLDESLFAVLQAL